MAEEAFKEWFGKRAHIAMQMRQSGNVEQFAAFMINEMVPPDEIVAPLFANTNAMSIKIIPSPGAPAIEIPRPDCMAIRQVHHSTAGETSSDSTQSTTP